MTGPAAEVASGSPAALADLLAAGEREAMRGTPAEAVAPLREAIELATREARRTEGLAAGWLLGVALGAGGRYGEAFGVLEPLAQVAGEEGGSVLFGALAAATAASLYRQLGRHEPARDLDSAGWAAVEPLGAPTDEARIDCALGLASDMVGLGEHDLAEEWVERAAGVVESRPEPGWRPQVRLHWVRAEIALSEEDPEDAAALADEALRIAERARAPRHVAKSLLFRGVALASAESSQAVPTLRRAATLAEGLGALPLVWPARAMLGALLGTDGGADLAAAGDVVRQIADGLPPALQAGWLARADVGALAQQP